MSQWGNVLTNWTKNLWWSIRWFIRVLDCVFSIFKKSPRVQSKSTKRRIKRITVKCSYIRDKNSWRVQELSRDLQRSGRDLESIQFDGKKLPDIGAKRFVLLLLLFISANYFCHHKAMERTSWDFISLRAPWSSNRRHTAML